MKKLIFFAVFLFALVDCCSKITSPVSFHQASVSANRTLFIDVQIDKDFTAQEKFEIEEALGRMNNFYNGYFIYRMKDDAATVNIDTISSLSDNDLLFVQDTDDGTTLGYSHGIPSNEITLYTNNLKVVNDPVIVIMHELLHSKGGIHSLHKGSILYPAYINQGTYDCIDQYAIKGVLKENSWIDKNKLNYCSI